MDTQRTKFNRRKNSKRNKGYERIFDFIPPISIYQIGLVCCALYPRFAAGAIQFGKIVLEAEGSAQKLVSLYVNS